MYCCRHESTSVDDLPEDVGALRGRAVPAPLTELPFALLDGALQAAADGVQDARVLPDQLPLLPAQQLQARVQDQLHVLGVCEQVRGGHVHDPPGTQHGERGDLTVIEML